MAMTAGLALLAEAGPGTAYFPTLFGAFAMMGVGGGMSFMPLLHIAMGEVPARDAGLASGLVNVSMLDRRRARPGCARRRGDRSHARACRPQLLARGGAARRL